MQPVNVLPTFLSQDTDSKAKVIFESLSDKPKEADFSSLVEQHVIDDKKVSGGKSAQVEVATRGHTFSSNGNSVKNSDDSRQENDSVPFARSNKSDKEAKENVELIAANKSLSQAANEDKTTDSEALTESEQFIALLYSSDQTLKSSIDRSKQLTDTHNQPMNSPQANNQKISQLNDENTKTRVANKNEQLDENKSSSISLEHKLKSFSKDELNARAVFKNNTLMPQLSIPKNAFNSANTTSEQLTDKQLSNADYNNNKLPDLAAGISQASTGQLAEQAESDMATLSKGLGKERPKELVFEGGVTQTDNKDSLLVKPQNNFDAQLVSAREIKRVSESTPEIELEQASAATQGSGTARPIITSGTESLSATSNMTETGNEQVSKSNVEKLMSEPNLPVASTIQSTIKESSLAEQVKQTMTTNAQVAQQAKAEQSGQPMASEQQGIEDTDKEYIDSRPLSQAWQEEKAIGADIKLASKVSSTVATQSTADLQAQTMQSTQAKQNTDAYMEYQSAEVLNHNVASDTAQIQKNNVQLQQETLSLFKKDFSDAVKDKVLVMINQKLQQFDITLDPPEFGNMQVRVNLQGEQATVNFVVQNQQAKEALEQNMHKLREMLAEQGVDVGGTNVEQQSQQQSNDGNDLPQNSDSKSLLSKQNQQEDNVEHVLSAELFNSPATAVDYYV